MGWNRRARSPAGGVRSCAVLPEERSRFARLDGRGDHGAAAFAGELVAHQPKPQGGASYAEQDLGPHGELGYDLDEEAEYPGTALFHGETFEIFPAGALGPYRIEHSGGAIRRIVAVDPNEHDVISDFKELIIDPMSERLALGGDRAQRATFPDYCDRARWIVDAKVPAHADSWLSTIEEAAGRRDSEREYLGRGDWKKLKKRMSVLPARRRLWPRPTSRRLRRQGKRFARSWPVRNAPDLVCSSSPRSKTICARWSA